MKTLLLAGLLFVMMLVLARSSDAKTRGAKSSAASDVTHLTVEELVARFQHEPAASIQEDEKADIDAFVAVPSPTGFMVDLPGTPFPRVSPTMRELVRRGIAVIPALLDHLSDARPTKLSLRGNTPRSPDNVSYLGNEYDSRQPDADKVPPGLFRIGGSEPGRGVEQFKIYRLKVGDLCFAALGQIVNRRLLGWRNWAGIMYGFNSPVHSPALTAAARADWAGLTDDGFRDFLIRDFEWLDKRGPTVTQPRNLPALERLLFYYPADGVALAVKLLDQPLIDTAAANACCRRLIDTDSEAEQDRLLSDFQAQHGHDDYEYLAQSVARIVARPTNAKGENPWILKRKREDENAVKLANRSLTDAERNPTFVESQFRCMERTDALLTMTLYPSAEIDAAVRRLLQRASSLHVNDWHLKDVQCDLVTDCARRLFSPARRKKLERSLSPLWRKWRAADKDEKNATEYVRACDAFMQKLASDPALQPQAGNP